MREICSPLNETHFGGKRIDDRLSLTGVKSTLRQPRACFLHGVDVGRRELEVFLVIEEGTEIELEPAARCVGRGKNLYPLEILAGIWKHKIATERDRCGFLAFDCLEEGSD